MRLVKRIILAASLLFAAACEALPFPLPRLVFETPTPRPIGPTATPLPAAIVNFAVRVPANTPPGSAPAVQLIDEVSGATTLVALTPAGADLWTGGAPATVGAVLRYRYVRPLPAQAPEVTTSRAPVLYRLAMVGDGLNTVSDVVAAWSDTPFAGQVGQIAGVVRNGNDGQGVMGVIVSAGGQTTLTAYDGSYALFNVPAADQRVTLLAPDGSLRPMQATAAVAVNQRAVLDFTSTDPNAVTVTFIAQPPAGAPNDAPMRIVGDAAQMGNTFVIGSSGSAVVAARAVPMVQLADGRWAGQATLYQGTVVRYAYTLGDGVWNAELDRNGRQRLREFVVPWTNTTVEDAIDTWHVGPSAEVGFELNVPATTPPNDLVTIQLRLTDWTTAVPMWRTGLNQWRFVLYNPTSFAGSAHYRYCRNYACGSADDASTAGSRAGGRPFTPTLFRQDVRDTLSEWRWLGSLTPPASPPAANRRLAFSGGVDVTEAYQPTHLPLYGELVRGLSAIGMNALTVNRRVAAQMAPAPHFADDLALTMPADELRALSEQARLSGLRFTVHPVTCAYTPYGACDYWSDAVYGPDFWNAWFAAYERHLLSQAEAARRAGADALVIGDFKLRPSFPGEPEAPPDAETRWRSLISNVRARFRGQIAFEMLMGQSLWPNPPRFLDSVDVIRVFWWAALAASPAPSATELNAAAAELLDAHLAPLQQQFNKPIHLSAAYYSADGAGTQCLKRDDGQCHLFTDFNPDMPDVVFYQLDLLEQADLYNALLSAVDGRPWVSGVSAYGYNPAVALRDKSLSVRGKPAELVLSGWFLRFQGR